MAVPVVRLRTVNTLRGSLTAFERKREWPSLARFEIREALGLVQITIKPGPDDDEPGYAEINASLSDDAVRWLSQWKETHTLLPDIHVEVEPFVDALRSAWQRLSVTLQFTYPLEAFRGFSEWATEWSMDGTTWERTTYGGRGYRGARVSWLELDDTSIPAIQDQLDRGVKPLEAFVHMQRAKDERDPRHRWLDATIAAELGAKEFLARCQPSLATLLVELPSPPLDKLYGPLLKEYAGEESPVRKWMKHGNEVRNQLIHRPGHPPPERQHAADYVNAVVAALYHLMALLYPDDDTIRTIAEDRRQLAEKGPPAQRRP